MKRFALLFSATALVCLSFAGCGGDAPASAAGSDVAKNSTRPTPPPMQASLATPPPQKSVALAPPVAVMPKVEKMQPTAPGDQLPPCHGRGNVVGTITVEGKTEYICGDGSRYRYGYRNPYYFPNNNNRRFNPRYNRNNSNYNNSNNYSSQYPNY